MCHRACAPGMGTHRANLENMNLKREGRREMDSTAGGVGVGAVGLFLYTVKSAKKQSILRCGQRRGEKEKHGCRPY